MKYCCKIPCFILSISNLKYLTFLLYKILLFLKNYYTQTLVLGLYISHLDYCNAILVGLPNCDIKKFQCVQSMCAKLVLDHDKYYSSTQALADLHWLNIRLHISFKILSLVHQCVYRTAPSYLQDLIVKLPVRRP